MGYIVIRADNNSSKVTAELFPDYEQARDYVEASMESDKKYLRENGYIGNAAQSGEHSYMVWCNKCDYDVEYVIEEEIY